MKLSKLTTIAVTSASAIIYSFGVLAVQASAEEIVSPEVSQQIQEALGSGDRDELLVDALSQVESQLREYDVDSFTPDSSDSESITELKQMRREYIQQLRDTMNSFDTQSDRAEFLAKIRARRREVRQKLFQVRRERFEENKARIEEQQQMKQEELETRREKFKQNLEARQEALKEKMRDPEEKFKDRVQEKQERLEAENELSEFEKAQKYRKEASDREQVQGAIDYQPQNLMERIGYWMRGL